MNLVDDYEILEETKAHKNTNKINYLSEKTPQNTSSNLTLNYDVETGCFKVYLKSYFFESPQDADTLITHTSANYLKNPFTFTGREYDAETGCYYYRARYYCPDNGGRFLSEDSIGFRGGDPNLYRYVFNNPTNYIDPYGEQGYLHVLGALAALGCFVAVLERNEEKVEEVRKNQCEANEGLLNDEPLSKEEKEAIEKCKLEAERKSVRSNFKDIIENAVPVPGSK